MADANKREIAESIFDRNQRREVEINNALKQEAARYEAAVKNMQRFSTRPRRYGRMPSPEMHQLVRWLQFSPTGKSTVINAVMSAMVKLGP